MPDAKTLKEALSGRMSKNLTLEELQEYAKKNKLTPIKTTKKDKSAFYRIKQAKTDTPTNFEEGTWEDAWAVVEGANCVFRLMVNPKSGEYLKIMGAGKYRE